MTNPVTQTIKSQKTSDNYKFISTEKLQEFVESMGFSHFKTVVTKTRKVENLGFQRHMLIFDHPSLKLKDERIQLMLVNSHDGSSSLKIMLGIYRLVCSNGLIVGKSLVEQRVNHKGNDFLVNTYASINKVIEQADQIKDLIGAMKNVIVADPYNFARPIFENRLDMVNVEFSGTSIAALRDGDRFDDLWTLYNRVQERAIRGGIKYLDNDGEVKTSRKVTGISSIIKINQFAWDHALLQLAV